MYADDVAIGSESKEELQKTLQNSAKWAARNNLEINIGKTVQMNFKKGRKQAQGDTLYISGNKLKVVKKFRYLSVSILLNIMFLHRWEDFS